MSTSSRLYQSASMRRAVSMIDLIITISIVGILASVAAPKFSSSYQSIQLEAVARRLVGDLRYARKVAIQTSSLTEVTFRVSPAGYDMTGVEHPARPHEVYSVDLGDLASRATLTSVSFDGSTTIAFNSYGRPLANHVGLNSGAIQVQLGGRTATVTINSATGEATYP